MVLQKDLEIEAFCQDSHEGSLQEGCFFLFLSDIAIIARENTKERAPTFQENQAKVIKSGSSGQSLFYPDSEFLARN